jgi:hypothetical protein
LCLLPMTAELYDEFRRGGEVDPRFAVYEFLPPAFPAVLAAWSEVDPVAYVEAEYFGGVGTQAAAVWDGGDLVLGPLVEPEGSPAPRGERTPISQALRRLGADAAGHYDEFEAVGLHRHRHLEDWAG